jgi:hypothetical protein
MAGFLQASFFHYPFALFHIYTIAPYDTSLITLYHCYLIVSIEDWSGPLEVGHHTPPQMASFGNFAHERQK